MVKTSEHIRVTVLLNKPFQKNVAQAPSFDHTLVKL